MKTMILTAVVILVCILNSMAWVNAHQTLEIAQTTADYYYVELTQANARITELTARVDELKNGLDVASNVVAELKDKNHELQNINYELKESSKLRYFKSTDELKAFLEESDVDHHVYLKPGQDWRTYDCDDYAIALRDDALSKGFFMNIQAVWRYRRPDTGELITGSYNEGHALNSTIIGNEVYFIEPQTDEFWLAAYLD